MRKGRVILVAALAAALILLGLAIAWRPAAQPTGGRTGLSVVVIAVDGLDWYLASHYMETRSLPIFEQFAKTAVLGEITADSPPIPEVGWTRFARGRPLSEDEMSTVTGLGDRRLTGRPPDVARIAADGGATVLSVAWPCSWPADPDEPFMMAAAPRPPAERHDLSLAPALYPDAPRQASSSAVSEAVREAVERRWDALDDEFRGDIFDGEAADPVWLENLVAARWSYLADATALDVAARLLASEEPDLTLVYLGGLDAITHRFLAPAMPGFFDETPQGSPAFADVLGNYYEFLDRAIQRFHRLRRSDTVILVCSVNGFHPGDSAGAVSGSHAQGPPGVLMAFSDKLKAKRVAGPVATVDLTATILAAIGVSIPNDLEGRIVTECIPSGRLALAPPEYVEPPARRAGPSPDGDLARVDALATERLERLRAGLSE